MQQGQEKREGQKKRGIVIIGIKPWHVVVLAISGIVIIASFGFLIGAIAAR